MILDNISLEDISSYDGGIVYGNDFNNNIYKCGFGSDNMHKLLFGNS